jgi:leader peptidase (prepilin peptidase)/N-methyltransferase
MIIGLLLLGWLSGYLMTLASDYLPSISNRQLARNPLSPPAVWQVFQTNCSYVHLGVELMTPAFWGYLWIYRPSNLALLAASYYFFVLIALIDLKYRLILNITTYPAIVFILGIRLLLHETSLNIWMGGIFAFFIFFLTALLKPGTLGGGDIKLATAIGFMLGFPEVLWALMIAAWAGGIGAVYLLVTGSDRTSRIYIPYAPFLSAGALIALLYNPFIIGLA